MSKTKNYTCIRKMFRYIKESFILFSHNTYIHGFQYIGDAKLPIWVRMFFITTFCTVAMYIIYLGQDIYAKWDNTPVIASYSPRPIIINKLPFPTVIICNVNQALASKVRNLSKTSAEYSMLQTVCGRSVENFDIGNMADIKTRSSVHRFIENNNQPCEALLVKCKFGSFVKNCDDIFKPILTDEGTCCIFNALHSQFLYRHKTTFDNLIRKDGSVGTNWDPENGYPKRLPTSYYPTVASGTGISMGLTIIIDAEVNDYYCSSTNGPGFKVMLQNPLDLPTPRENGLFVRVGSEMTFRIKANRFEASEDVRSFSIRDRQCVFNSERRLRYFKTYTRSNCLIECRVNKTAEMCGCIGYFAPELWQEMRVCSLKDQKCTHASLNWNTVTKGKSKQLDCMQSCMESCYDLSFLPARFEIPLSIGKFGTKEKILENYNETYLRKNIAVLNFYYEFSQVDAYTRTRFIGPTEVLSSMGGLTGLLGFSCITLAEALFFYILRSSNAIFGWWRKLFQRFCINNRVSIRKRREKSVTSEITRSGDSRIKALRRFGKMDSGRVNNWMIYRRKSRI